MELVREGGRHRMKTEGPEELIFEYDIRKYQETKIMFGAVNCEEEDDTVSHQGKNPDEGFYQVIIRKVNQI